MPEKDPSKSIREEFPSVSPGSDHAAENRVGHRHHNGLGNRKSFKIPTETYIQQVTENPDEFERHVLPKVYIYGEFEIEHIDRMRGEKRGNLELHISHMLQYPKSSLLEKLQNPPHQLTSDYSELAAFRVIQDAVEMGFVIKDGVSLIQQAKDFIESLDDEKFEKFLRVHAATEKEKSKNFDRNKEKLREFADRLIVRLETAIAEDLLPNTLDMAKIKERVKQLEYNSSGGDILFPMGLGVYEPLKHLIGLFAFHSDDAENNNLRYEQIIDLIDALFCHEALHAVSGKDFAQSASSEEKRVAKNGLAFTFSEQRRQSLISEHIRPTPRFTWLDEAVTEAIKTKLRGKEQFNQRKIESRLYELLLEKAAADIPEELFEEAYFEDFDPSAPAGKRLPKWNKLRHAINKSYDSHFLIELDDFILAYDGTSMRDFVPEKGLNRAVEFLEELQKGEYGRSSKTLQEIRVEKAQELGLRSKATWKEIAEAEIPYKYPEVQKQNLA